LDQDFLYNILGSARIFAQFKQTATGGVVNNLNSEIVRRVQIPLPPMEVQKEIVEEIEGYQESSTVPALYSTTTAPTFPSIPTGRWWRLGKFVS